MLTVTLEMARKTLKEVVSEKPADFRYISKALVGSGEFTQCYYAPNSAYSDNRAKTGCVVGETLTKLGLKMDSDALIGVGGLALRLEASGVAKVEPEAVKYLSVAQRTQDQAGTWAEALEKSEEYLKHPSRESHYLPVT